MLSSSLFPGDGDIGYWSDHSNSLEKLAENKDILFRGTDSVTCAADEDWRLKSRLSLYGSWQTYEKEAALPGFSTRSFGLTTGLLRHGKKNLFLGFGAGGDWFSADEKTGVLQKDVNAFKLFGHGGIDRDQWSWDIHAGYGYHDQKLMHSFNASQWNGKRTAEQYGISTEFRIKVSSGLFQMEPFLGFDYLNLEESPYQAKPVFGTLSPMNVSSSNHTVKGGTLGLRYRWRQTSLFATWYPELSGSWSHEFGGGDLFRTSWNDPFPCVYTVSGYESGRDRLIFGASLTGKFGRSMDIFIRYNASMTNRENMHTVFTGMSWYF
ncbi:MAG: autotransporter outer membrane beta-barrel domain-containing protein [Planctomycetaceae bacterium]|jgi:uncharacterized protein with beta-barrel porin domain|nr:autotransporter outer membrane beta-barrel domain-containing protein [Planctomycetaceae bacterium]